jgi:hypothetical protein
MCCLCCLGLPPWAYLCISCLCLCDPFLLMTWLVRCGPVWSGVCCCSLGIVQHCALERCWSSSCGQSITVGLVKACVLESLILGCQCFPTACSGGLVLVQEAVVVGACSVRSGVSRLRAPHTCVHPTLSPPWSLTHKQYPACRHTVRGSSGVATVLVSSSHVVGIRCRASVESTRAVC